MLDDPWRLLDDPAPDDGPPVKPARRGPPGEWGGRPRLAWLVALVAAAAGAVAVAVTGSASTPPPAPAPVARASALPFPSLPAVPVAPAAVHPNLQPLLRHLANRGTRVFCGSAHGNQIALTFDDGPGPRTIPILRILTHDHVPATFFLIGRLVQAMPQLPKLELSLGMAIGDHTQTHPDLTKLPGAEVRGELTDARDAIVAATGKPVTLFRPPYGARDARVDAQARALGLLEVLWDVDTRDSDRATPPTILANARRGLRPGSIVLMHEDATTVSVLPQILRSMRARHLQPVTVPQLIAGGHRTKTCPYIPYAE